MRVKGLAVASLSLAVLSLCATRGGAQEPPAGQGAGGGGESSGRQMQSEQDRRPALLLQPGMLSADFWSPPDGFPATSGFNLRFATLVPTSSRWWTLIVGASVTPYGTSGVSVRSTNTPVLFVGNVFPGIPARRTGGWFDLSFPVYLTYSYAGGGEHNRQIYGRDFVGEAALQFFIGEKVLGDLGPTFRRLRLYAMMNQLLTPNRDRTSGTTDRFNPVALYGVTIPIGGRGTVR
jgi:hypothetical protein